jgi:hypothetical protein
MKPILLLLLPALILASCQQPADNTKPLQNRIDSLEKKVAESYKPGFGEFMSSIQSHHSKLWFAGQNNNWKLADFEIGEIKEALEGIRKYDTDRKESEQLVMLNPAIDSMSGAIAQKNPARFKSAFHLLTTTCNNCHHAVSFEFNVIKVPDASPYTNQDFNSGDKK